jgi:hypothetical protein
MSQSLVPAVLEGKSTQIKCCRDSNSWRFSRDAFCLFYDAKTKTVQALNGSGHSPEKLSLDHVRKRGINGLYIPRADLNSVTVPGQPVE